MSYEIFWDSEGGYDHTRFQFTFDGGATWADFLVTDTLSYQPMLYDNTGIPGGITETFSVAGPGGTDNIPSESIQKRGADRVMGDCPDRPPPRGAFVCEERVYRNGGGKSPPAAPSGDAGPPLSFARTAPGRIPVGITISN